MQTDDTKVDVPVSGHIKIFADEKHNMDGLDLEMHVYCFLLITVRIKTD